MIKIAVIPVPDYITTPPIQDADYTREELDSPITALRMLCGKSDRRIRKVFTDYMESRMKMRREFLVAWSMQYPLAREALEKLGKEYKNDLFWAIRTFPMRSKEHIDDYMRSIAEKDMDVWEALYLHVSETSDVVPLGYLMELLELDRANIATNFAVVASWEDYRVVAHQCESLKADGYDDYARKVALEAIHELKQKMNRPITVFQRVPRAS